MVINVASKNSTICQKMSIIGKALSVRLCDMIVANESDEGIMISLRVQWSTKNPYLLSWHKSQGLGLPISLKIMLA